MRVLICGSRDYEDSFNFFGTVERILDERQIIDPVIIHGAADGADTLADDYAKVNYYRCLRFPAKWPLYGKRAGTLRNIQMLEEGKPHLVIAFPTKESIGTRHMISISQKAGIPVEIIEVEV